MRLTVILLTAFLLQANASTLAQTVTLSGRTIPLKKVFTAIKQQTGYVVFSNTNTINDAQNVSLSVRDMPLKDLLDVVLKDFPVSYLIRDKTIVLSRKAVPAVNFLEIPAPPAGVSGVIRSATGEPLQGASIRVKNNSSGTGSGPDGTFSLMRVPEDGVLIISMLGYESMEIGIRKTANGYTAFAVNKSQSGALKVSEGNSVNISVTLSKKELEMQDVVVTGYMNVNKGMYVGAVYSVKADDIKIAGETSIDQMLQGVVPGMSVMVQSGQVGSTPKIRIRGTSTILGNQEPLWVVDGVIQRDPLPLPSGSGALAGDMSEMRLLASNAISWLNPNDIDGITVLKDASATAIYGSQAANGVIVLTTKKARPGTLAVSYSNNLTVGQRPTYGMFDLMNSQELMQFSKEVYQGRDSYTYNILPIGYGGLIQQLQDKAIDQATFNERYRKMESENTDWFGLLFRNAFSQNHNVSISGGTEKIVNRTSFSMQQQKGEAKGNDLKTFSASSNTTLRFGSRLTVNLMLNGSIRETDGFAYGVDPFQYAYNTSRTIPMYNEDGTLFYHEKRGEGSTAIPNKLSYQYNIQNELDNTGNKNTTTTLASTVDVRLQVLKGLEYQGLLSYTTAASNVKSYATELSHYITQVRGYEFGSVLSNSTEELASRLPFGGLAQLENSSNKGYTFRNSLVYNKLFGSRHNMILQGGVEARSTLTEGNVGTRYGYLRYRGESYAPVPLAPTAIGGTSGNLHENMRLNSRIVNQESNFLSEYFSAVYGFDQRYVFNFNARLDASNRFGQDKNKRFQPTWSVGGRWRLGNEKFLERAKWLNALDLSATYGYQGNAVEAISPYLIATDGGLSSIFKQYTLNIKSLPYPDLGWEKTKTWNLGADISLWNGRFSATVNWFKKSSNILASRQIPVENGMNSAIVFGSLMENTGYDLMISVTPVRTKDFTWQFSVNTGLARNVLKENERVNTREDYLNGTAIVNGESYSTFYSYAYAGLNKTNGVPLFRNMDIKPTENDLDYLVRSGKLEPDFTGGFNTLFRYRNISLSAQFAMAFGAQKRVPVFYNNTGAPTPEQNVPRELQNRWKKPGDELYTNIPAVPPGRPSVTEITLPTLNPARASAYNLYNQSDYMVANADFIRCRSIAVNYEFQQALLKTLRIKRLSTSLSMTNPFLTVFDEKWRGYDPETAGWPARKSASLSFNMTF
ncbi:SusC/RagA family TonB-linked outer membrane protein [Chitinophaga sp. SYP-B3965]|uniref:SusC/RagA family TonB-linked outer membrane protein n=1 Tax=Chitinophaga sp. SYP-B3965 TaxID=2663120 RepID=UPI001299ECE0|nr:SusC/RagA family TonB-linked outer membrane protein [Chitinophaga sp. SYP-B3965]MRG43579.1 SusC/RagA family TonB-linked outer membrane protein [Chitinophaga sp. SYP-B3965]